jgi:hypothetical protein
MGGRGTDEQQGEQDGSQLITRETLPARMMGRQDALA